MSKAAAVWLAGTALALFAIGTVMQRTAEGLLQSDAEQAAMQWAAFARDSVPDLQQALAGRGFTLEALRQLRRLRDAEGVFRFCLYDDAGVPLLASDDLDRDEPLMPGAVARCVDRTDLVGHLAPALHGQPTAVVLRSAAPTGPRVYSAAFVPVMHDGRAIGIVQVDVDQTEQAVRVNRAFQRVALAAAVLLALVVGAAVWQRWMRSRSQRQAEEQVKFLAHHDVLTGLLNRAGFHDALAYAEERAADGGPRFAIMCINLDGFKEVNASLGPEGADELLRQVGLRLRHALREIDVLARLGGDEFAVLQAGVEHAADVELLGHRLAAALAAPYGSGEHELRVPATLGAALYGVDDREGVELLHKAERALRRAKAQHRGSFSLYDAAMDQRLQSRLALQRDLRQALYDGDLYLHFQPLYESDGRTLGGYEALVRWHHPDRGPVPPAEFIPLAEECGLIGDLGLWVLAHACEEAVLWPASLSVSVNLSPAQFRDGPALVRQVANCLESSGLSASRLELEVTESLLIGNTDSVVETLHALTDMGVRIAMDDFGTGYSSLAYLWRFPFDKVKIDRAFTQNLDQDPRVELIVRSIVSLAHALNIRVNAEGVETPAQMQCLQRHGCDELQGYLLGRPAPPTHLRHDGAPQAAEPRLPRARTDIAPLSTRPTTLQ